MAARELHVVGHLTRVVHGMSIIETRALARRRTGAGHLLRGVGVRMFPGIDLPGGDLRAADHLLVCGASPRGVLELWLLALATTSRATAAAMASGGPRRGFVGCPLALAVRAAALPRDTGALLSLK